MLPSLCQCYVSLQPCLHDCFFSCIISFTLMVLFLIQQLASSRSLSAVDGFTTTLKNEIESNYFAKSVTLRASHLYCSSVNLFLDLNLRACSQHRSLRFVMRWCSRKKSRISRQHNSRLHRSIWFLKELFSHPRFCTLVFCFFRFARMI